MADQYPFKTVPLKPHHEVATFDCGTPSLNDFLRAGCDQIAQGLSSIFVYAQENRVLGFYSLASWQVKEDDATESVLAGGRASIPAIVLGKLAVDKSYQKQGLGKALVKEAIFRAIESSRLVGARALVVHVDKKDLAEFYKALGFDRSTPAGII